MMAMSDTFRTTFDRTLTVADSKQNIPFPFQVPTGTTQLNLRLTFSPLVVDDINNLLTLSLFDPAGFRGAGHRQAEEHRVTINAHRSTPGYRAGPIQPGAWTAVLDTHMIVPGAPCPIRLEVSGTDESHNEMAVPGPHGHTASRGRGWYRGDLHAHTLHSDAEWDIPDLLKWVREHQLDFCTLSDHNTVSGLAEIDAASADDLLTMGGMELTTFRGHALALGLRAWVDWRVRDGQRTIEQIAAEVSARGALFVIAHPASIGDPYCTGCRWVYETMMPGAARAVEAWNGPWWGDGSSNNEDALALVYRWLNEGNRLALTAGTDNHGSEPENTSPHGFNVVYADDLSERDILRAVRAGHLYLSSGAKLELSASLGDHHAMMGDVLNVPRAVPIQLAVQWADCLDDAQLSLIVDGESRATIPVRASGQQTWELEGGRAHWCLLTLRARDRTMLALTNPIYFDGRD
jgi:hypothetical protein